MCCSSLLYTTKSGRPRAASLIANIQRYQAQAHHKNTDKQCIEQNDQRHGVNKPYPFARFNPNAVMSDKELKATIIKPAYPVNLNGHSENDVIDVSASWNSFP